MIKDQQEAIVQKLNSLGGSTSMKLKIDEDIVYPKFLGIQTRNVPLRMIKSHREMVQFQN